jgi:type VI protein secretion system component Hcp
MLGDSFMWFPGAGEAGIGGYWPVGETNDAWFEDAKVKPFEITTFSLGVAQNPEAPTSEPSPGSRGGGNLQSSSGSEGLTPELLRNSPVFRHYNPPTPPPAPLTPDLLRSARTRLRPVAGRKSGVKFTDLTVSKVVDLASVSLYRACTDKSIFDSAIVALRVVGEAPSGTTAKRARPLMYLQYVFHEVQVVGITWNAATYESGGRSTEKVVFKYRGLGAQYTPQLATGLPGTALSWAWDERNNQVLTGEQYFVKS